MTLKSDSDTGGMFASDPPLKWHQNQRPLQVLFYWRGLFSLFALCKRTTSTDKAKGSSTAGLPWSTKATSKPPGCKSVRGDDWPMHTADEWGLRQARGLYQGQVWVKTVCPNPSRLQPKLEEIVFFCEMLINYLLVLKSEILKTLKLIMVDILRKAAAWSYKNSQTYLTYHTQLGLTEFTQLCA